jgi:sigma-B regulation protein RsbU (phosphoserine phosphatase)
MYTAISATDVTPARRLKEYFLLVQELSQKRDAHELIESYRQRARFVVPTDGVVSLSRKGMQDGKVRITRASHWKESINPWKEPHRLPIIESGFLPQIISTGKPVKIDHLEIDPDDPFGPYAEGMRSLVAIPVFDNGRPDYMVLGMRIEPAAFTLDDMATLLLTTNLVGRVTSHILLSSELERLNGALDREFRAVGEAQRELLPKQFPSIPAVRFAAHYETSTRAGGDYYDFLDLGRGRWGFLIADVSGHGAAAAVTTAVLHALAQAPLRACPMADSDPAAALAFLNSEMLRSTRTGQFVTAWLGVYDVDKRSLRYASAGHNPPRLLRANEQRVHALESHDGLPLGIVPDFACSTTEIRVSPGDRLLLYTDGITETFNSARQMFGTDGLDAVLSCCSRTPERLIDAIRDEVNVFSFAAPAADDRTLVAIAFD